MEYTNYMGKTFLGILQKKAHFSLLSNMYVCGGWLNLTDSRQFRIDDTTSVRLLMSKDSSYFTAFSHSVCSTKDSHALLYYATTIQVTSLPSAGMCCEFVSLLTHQWDLRSLAFLAGSPAPLMAQCMCRHGDNCWHISGDISPPSFLLSLTVLSSLMLWMMSSMGWNWVSSLFFSLTILKMEEKAPRTAHRLLVLMFFNGP